MLTLIKKLLFKSCSGILFENLRAIIIDIALRFPPESEARVALMNLIHLSYEYQTNDLLLSKSIIGPKSDVLRKCIIDRYFNQSYR